MVAKKANKTLEQTLWEAADKLHANQEPPEYKHVVLGLVFLKYVSDRFEERRSTLTKELHGDSIDESQFNDFLEDRDEYAGHNVCWAPEGARWRFHIHRAIWFCFGQDPLRTSFFPCTQKLNTNMSKVLELQHLEPQNRKLATRRDTLLPELMSGRIRVREARNAVEEAIDQEIGAKDDW